MTFANLSLDEVLDDLSSRFLINVPEEELVSIERICFQIEQAHWFYEDFVRQENTELPSIPTLKQFFGRFFRHCPFLHPYVELHDQAFKDFMQYKFRVPVCGAIILNHQLDKVLLVKGWNSKSWSWPRGKINKGELELNCAVREVLEETGFDMTKYLPENPGFSEITIKEQRIRLYFVPGVSEDEQFETQTRKEISDIQWHVLDHLPGFSSAGVPASIRKMKYYMLTPFFSALKKYIHSGRATREQQPAQRQKSLPPPVQQSLPPTAEQSVRQPAQQVPTPVRPLKKNSDLSKPGWYAPLVQFQFDTGKIRACLLPAPV